MRLILFTLLIACGKKAETTVSSSSSTTETTETTETSSSSTIDASDATKISVSTKSNTPNASLTASPTNSIEIKAIVRPADEAEETKEVLPLPEDSEGIDDTVDND